MSISHADFGYAAGITLAAFTQRLRGFDPLGPIENLTHAADPARYFEQQHERGLMRLIADRRGPAFRRVYNERWLAHCHAVGLPEKWANDNLPYGSHATKDKDTDEVSETISDERPVAPGAGQNQLPLEQPAGGTPPASTLAAEAQGGAQ